MAWQFAVLAAAAAANALLRQSAAYQQNRAIGRSMRSAVETTAIRERQIADSAALERAKHVARFGQMAGRIQVAAAQAGVGFGGSFAALDRQAAIDAGYEVAIVNQNETNEQVSLQSAFDATVQSLRAQWQDPLIAMFTGAVSGTQTGLQIAGGLQQLGVK